MRPITEFLASGILELYVMGAASPQEALEVERMAALYPEVRQEMDAISLAMENYALAHAVTPPSNVKPLLLATINYMERLAQGEVPVEPPLVTEASTPEDFAPWLEREDMTLLEDTENIYASILSATPAVTTAIAWIKEKSDYEVHDEAYERFLIIEGTCNIIAGGKTYALAPGDFYAVPLHVPHMLEVTSAIPCKAILQRVSV
jgi:mannose-6-phosphate isomerase-like protein (cupin superfamily)